MYQYFLLAIDGSAHAERAASVGIELARALGARVLAFHAAPPYASLSYLIEVLGTPQRDYELAMSEHAERYLASIAQAADVVGVSFASEYRYASQPYEAIIDMAKARGCDLIVMGARGRHGVSHHLLGSVTHRVLLHGHLPVLVFP